MVKLRNAVPFVAASAFAMNASADMMRPISPMAPPPSASTSIVSAGSLLQVGLSLMLVLAAIAAVAWVAKRLNPTSTGGGSGNALRVVSATSVGQRERVVLVEVGATWLVVGVAPGHVTSLHSMPKPDIAPGSTDTHAPDNKFAAWLRQTMEKRRNA